MNVPLIERATSILDATSAHFVAIQAFVANTDSSVPSAGLWSLVSDGFRDAADGLERELARLAVMAIGQSQQSVLIGDSDRRAFRRAVRGAIASLRLRGFEFWDEHLHYDEDIFRGKTPEGEREYNLGSVEAALESFTTHFESIRRFLLFVEEQAVEQKPVEPQAEAHAPYDVALSFAGEDRAFAEALAECLKRHGVKSFYDGYEEADLWGKDLYQHLQNVYRDKARFCVIFVSAAYAAKLWTRHELKQAQARAFRENREYILPVRLDNTELPGLNDTVGYLDLRQKDIATVCRLLVRKLADQMQQTGESVGAPNALRDTTEDDDEPELLDIRVQMDDAFAGAMRLVAEISQLFASGTEIHVRRKGEVDSILVDKGRNPRRAHDFASSYAKDLADFATALNERVRDYLDLTNAFFDSLETMVAIQIRDGISSPQELLEGLNRFARADIGAKAAEETYANVQRSLAALKAPTKEFRRKRRQAVEAIELYRAALRHWVNRSEEVRRKVQILPEIS